MASKNPIIQKIINRFEKEFGHKRINTRQAVTWFRKVLPKDYQHIKKSQLMRDRTAIKSKVRLGSIYLWSYDALHKQKLPYWDAFPLVLVLDAFSKNSKNYILGINFHYLPPVMRALVFLELKKFQKGRLDNKKTVMRVQWSKLKALSNHKLYEHSIKLYRLDHVRSKFILIDPRTWGIVMMLPLARFKKASTKKVWSDVRKKLKNK